MAFWSSARLEQALNDPRINLIQPITGGRVKQGAYELAVGEDYYVTGGVKKKLERNEVIKIPPGQLALLITSERVNMPLDTIGFISMKFKYKMRGLINVSGFHVDPGFRGRLKFAVFNAGNKPAHFSPGKPLFLIWFSELTGEPNNDYDGEHQDQDRISAEDIDQIYGKMASPGSSGVSCNH